MSEGSEPLKRSLRFVQRAPTVDVKLADGTLLGIPVVTGILKHPAQDRLPTLLRKPEVLRKYTCEALRVAAWPVLRLFPRDWLLDNLPHASVRPGRAEAIRFLLS